MARINTNIASIIAQGRLRINTNDLNTRLERLSTGLRINRGKDDPAGLIASETLRSEIGAIRQAIDNSQRAINVLSTAEGALNEVSNLLVEIQALVTQMANSGGLSPDEMTANQAEIDSIVASIDRIANTTEFSGKKLLNGQLDYTLSGVQTAALASIQVFGARIPEGGTKAVTVQITNSAETALLSFTGATTSAVTIELAGTRGTEILPFAAGTTQSAIRAAINDVRLVTGVSAVVAAGALRLNSIDFGSEAFVSVKSITGNFFSAAQLAAGQTVRDDGVDPDVLVNGQKASARGLRVDSRSDTLDSRFYLNSVFAQRLSQSTFRITGGGSLFQISPEVTPQGQVNLGLQSVTTANLGNTVVGYLNTIKSGGTNAVIDEHFVAAGDIVAEAIKQVAVFRGRLGSLQRNQIETSISSQQIALENVTAAESAIRDADIAVEISALTRAQILVQATQLTLGIANQIPQQALQLLG